MVGGDARSVSQHHAAHAPLAAGHFDVEIVDTALKAILAAQRLDCPAQALHHGHEPECADMRMRFGENFLRRAGLDELCQHLAAKKARILDLAVEFAVRKCARAAFAELHIGFGIEDGAAPKPPRVLGAFAHDLAAIQDDRSKPHLRQDEAGEQSAWSSADHEWAVFDVFRRTRDKAVFHVRRRTHMHIARETFQNGHLVAQGHVERVDIDDRRFLAGVVRAFEHRDGDEFARGNAQPLENRGPDCVRPMVERQLDFRQTQHGRTISQAASQREGRLRKSCALPIQAA